MPTLAATRTVMPSIENGGVQRLADGFGEHLGVVLLDVQDEDGELVAAEPGEQAVLVRQALVQRVATCRSKSSPAWWPSESLTSLKRSRSSSSSAPVRSGSPARWLSTCS